MLTEDHHRRRRGVGWQQCLGRSVGADHLMATTTRPPLMARCPSSSSA